MICRGKYYWPTGKPVTSRIELEILATDNKFRWATEDKRKDKKDCIDCGEEHHDFGLVCGKCFDQILEVIRNGI